jgi:predicted negative regulator of RcsB-dependent stress response
VSSEVSKWCGTQAALTRSRSADDPELLTAKQNLEAAKIEAAVAKCLASAHRPTDEQLDRIAALLRAGGAP